ncbi:phosphatidylserine decarboxylase [Dimargaris cristalligena]|nr:phosphatidylserine decarboxylase [Dimargaris cristalligena]
MLAATKTLTVRLQILQGRGLAPKDKNGLADPYVIATYGKRKQSTHIVYENLDPIWNCSFDFTLNLKNLVPSLHLVVWDYNRLRHSYMGQLEISLKDMFVDQQPRLYKPSRENALWYTLTPGTGKHAGATVAGEVLINSGFVTPPAESQTPAWKAQWDTLKQVLFAPSNSPHEPELPLSEEFDGDYDEDRSPAEAPTASSEARPANMPKDHFADLTQSPGSGPPPRPYVSLQETLRDYLQESLHQPERPALNPSHLSLSPRGPPDATLTDPAPDPVPDPGEDPTPRSRPDDGSSDTLQAQEWRAAFNSSPLTLPITPSQASFQSVVGPLGEARRPQGVVFIEISSASDLPRAPNATRTGFDMDPFVVIGFARKTWRTTTKRHKLNPQWNEKLSFPLYSHELNYPLRFSLYDYDKLSNNDHIGTVSLPLTHVVQYFETQYAEILSSHRFDTQLMPHFDMEDLPLDLALTKKSWQDHHTSQLHIRVSYAPYAVLRRKFWLAMCRQYDSDENGTMNLTEVQTMLDSLGSTLSDDIIDQFFYRVDKFPDQDDLSFGELIDGIEHYTFHASRRSSRDDLVTSGQTQAQTTHALLTEALKNSTIAATRRPSTPGLGEFAHEPIATVPSDESVKSAPAATALPQTKIAKVRSRGSSLLEVAKKSGSHLIQAAKRKVRKPSLANNSAPPSPEGGNSPNIPSTPNMERGDPLSGMFSLGDSNEPVTEPIRGGEGDGQTPMETSTGGHSHSSSSGSSEGEASGQTTPRSTPKIIQATACPICQRYPIAELSDLDTINHVASCYIRDTNKSSRERFVMDNYVTESQAQRKWFTRMVKYVGYGGYAVGKNNANIIVLDRASGTHIEEKMPAYIRIGIRLLYKTVGSKSPASQRTIRNLLKSLSIKQGRKYDDPLSAKQIKSFIAFHNLNVDEILDPLDSFTTFNEFFYRKLKPTARPNPAPHDPRVALSPADCRFMAFDTLGDATRIWIKGRNFNLTRLLGGFSHLANQFEGGRLAIFRLAPQDYHRFHMPVDGDMLKSFPVHETFGAFSEVTPAGEEDSGGIVANASTASVVTTHDGLVHFPYIIPGDYYTVNPMAIRSPLDVYGENVRVINLIDSPQFGLVAFVSIGAMMVGSVVITSQPGQFYSRMDEHGYFKFGGSTCILLFQKDRIDFDRDLIDNSNLPIETLLRMGSTIGTARSHSS